MAALSPELMQLLQKGVVIPAHPLAFALNVTKQVDVNATTSRRWRRSLRGKRNTSRVDRAVARYSLASGYPRADGFS